MTTDRVFKTLKTVKYAINLTSADALLTYTNARGVAATYLDISDINWDRIIMEVNTTTLTGTSFVVKAITTNDDTNAGATTDAAAVQGDGSTAFTSGTINATGRVAVGCARMASTGATASNIGKYIGLWVDVTSTTVVIGTAWLFIQGR